MSTSSGPSTVHVVAGPAGSGKSTLGRALASSTDAVLLDQDVLTNPLMAELAALLGAGENLDHPALRGPVRRARYDCLIDVAVENSALGRNVVMVAPFTRECSDPLAWSELVRHFAPARVALVWVTVSPALARARRIQRNLPRDAVAQLISPDGPVTEPVVEHLRASGSADPAAEAARLVGLSARLG